MYIIAELFGVNTPITIDTGANICCITHNLVPHNNHITHENINITGPNNEPLKLIGSTIISIIIQHNHFQIKVYIIENLSCPLIIGNDFLSKHSAKINFVNKTITLDNTITVQIHNDSKNLNINKIQYMTQNLFYMTPYYPIAHCISQDLKMSKGIAADIKLTYGDATHILKALNPQIGDAIPIQFKNTTIYYLITKTYYYHKPTLHNIHKAIHNLKNALNDNNTHRIAIPKLASGLDKQIWSNIEHIIHSEFSNSNIDVIICSLDTNTPLINKMDVPEPSFYGKKHNLHEKILSTYNNFKPGENIPGDGNCGIYAICNALNDNKQNKITTLSSILQLFNLTSLPNYWWSDEDLATVASHYGHNAYFYNDSDNTGIIFFHNTNFNTPSILLYLTNNNTHWIPGTKSIKPSHKIPISYAILNYTTTLLDIKTKINSHIKSSFNNNSCNNNTLISEIDDQNIKQHKPLTNHTNTFTNDNSNSLIQSSKINIYDAEGTQINISPNLNLNEHTLVINLLRQFIHLFSSDFSNLKVANVQPCEIPLRPNCTEPKFNAPHRVSPQQRDELKTQLDKLTAAAIIRPIISKFAAPAFLVKKKEQGSYRLVVSYKELNDRVETDQYPIPRTTDLLRALEGSQFYSTLDLNSGFFQLPIKFEDQYKLAFTSIHGLMTFTRLPQGYKNSSALFQRTLNEAFSPLLYKSLIIYIDDLASYGNNFNQALKNLKEALIILDKMNFSLKTNKCNFFNDKIELLGHLISIKGIKPLNRNTKAILEFKQPKTQKDVRSFIGMCSYYRKHIKDFAKIAHPLTELIKGDTKKILWDTTHTIAFETLKKQLIAEPLLKHFNDDSPVFLTIDASLIGLGACLEQPDIHNTLHPIGYASRKLLSNEKTYSSTTLELLGLCFGITYFREYLWGRYFTVFCDNISIQYYKNLKIPSARIARLTLKLLDFNFDVIYKKGKDNKVADALSRNPINIINKHTVDYTDINKYDIKALQSKDQFCIDITNAIDKNHTNTNIMRKSRQFTIINEILYYKHYTPIKTITHLLVIPLSITNDILKSYHESPIGGHTGIARTIHKLQNKYYWATLSKDTTQYIKSCHLCQINKKLPGKPIGKLQPIPISNKPMDRLVFDYLGPLVSSNRKKYILVAACSSTKYIFTKAVDAATADATVQLIIQIVSQWGSFRTFSSDRGTHFRNNLVSEVLHNLGIKQVLSTAYSPETQGFVERINGILCGSLKNYIIDNDQTKWSYFLPYITLSYNATPQTTTKQSPFYLMHGFEPFFPIDSKLIPDNIPHNIQKSLKQLQIVRNKLPQVVQAAQNTQKKYYDQTHRIIEYQPGDLVLIKFPFLQIGKSPKLAPKYRGPFKILEKISDLNYKVKITLNNKDTEDIIHVRRIKPYLIRPH